MELNGRTILYAPYESITKENIVEMFNLILNTFLANQSDMCYLKKYFKGVQPILQRTKKFRSEINNKIVENHANEITTFKVGYLLNKPIQYVARKDSVDDKSVELLNDYIVVEDKEGKDKTLAKNQSICGTAYRLILPNNKFVDDGNESPFNIYDVDPTCALVVYSTKIERKPIFGGFIYVVKGKDNNNQDVDKYVLEGYTDNEYFRFENGNLEVKPNPMGMIPLIEYPLNDERIGDFEKVIPLLDAINIVQSNRVDGVEQFIQALLVLKNVDIDSDGIVSLREQGAIKIKDNGSGDKKVEANISYLTQELNQEQVQKLKDDMYKVVLTICGMPNRNGGKSTSDTGSAVIMRDGWSDAEARASETETTFRTSEKKALKLMLRIARDITKAKLTLSLSDLDIKFTRRNYENIYQKAQVLDLLLKNPKVDPRYAFVICGLFSDPETAFNESEKYYKEYLAKEQKGEK